MSSDLTETSAVPAAGRPSGHPESIPARPRRGPAQVWSALKRFARTEPLGMVSLVIIVVIVLLAVFAPLVAPYDPLLQHRDRTLEAPSGEFLLGTDDLGRDVLSRLIYGARSSLLIAVLTTGISLVLGTVLGIVSGFFGRVKIW